MNKQQELRMRLDFIMPMDWMTSFVPITSTKKEQLEKVVELNPQWVEEVINNRFEHSLNDIVHDFRGILSEDEHFLPRITEENINLWR
jgi:hypothetical protein